MVKRKNRLSAILMAIVVVCNSVILSGQFSWLALGAVIFGAMALILNLLER